MSGGDEADQPTDPFSSAAEENTDAGASGADDDPGTGVSAADGDGGEGGKAESIDADGDSEFVDTGGESAGADTEPVGADGAWEGADSESAGADTEGLEEVLDPLTAMTIERDEYLDTLRRVQAEFENYKKRMVRQQTEQLERAAEGLVNKLLPALDTLALALSHIDTDATEEGKALAQIGNAVWDVLAKEGLEKVEPLDQDFDPNESEAVMHEPAEEGQDGSKVVEVFRPGYRWRGRVLRAAMVKVRG